MGQFPDITTADDVAAVAGIPTDSTPTAPPPEINLTQLAAFVRNRFNKARSARSKVEQQMLEDILQRRSRYSDSKLAAIREVMGKNVDPPYMGITESKCEAIYGWLVDGILPPGEMPFSVEPTPIPELPPFIRGEIEKKVLGVMEMQFAQMAGSGMPIDRNNAYQQYDVLMKEAKEKIETLVAHEARDSAKKMSMKIGDLLAEASWENSLRQSLKDLVDCGTAILRGPVMREVPIRRSALNPESRKYETTYEHEIIPLVERLVPLRFYPSPDATRSSMPWYVYVNSMTRKDLAACLADESYDVEAVKKALNAYGDKGYREITAVEMEKASLENRIGPPTDSELLDRLEYGGSVPGKLLMEFGMTGLVPEQEYDALLWLVGEYIIKAVVNPDPVGLNYIFSAGFSEQPDSFWGISVPRKMRHSQNIANVAARQIVMNMGLASGPMMELNMDRMWPGENFTVRPFMAIKSTNAMMQEGKAVNFYQPQMVTRQLVEVFNFCLQLSDHETGIPRILYAGETDTPTASAASMLMSQAAKGGQNVIRNIDSGIIIPCVQAFFNYVLQYDAADTEYFGDFKIVARGSNTMVAKEQKVLRLKEILRDANNPTDLQVITVPIRAKLWKETVEALGISPTIFGDEDEIDERAAQMQMMQQQQQLMSGSPAQAEGAGTNRIPPAATATLPGSTLQVGSQENPMFTSQEGSLP